MQSATGLDWEVIFPGNVANHFSRLGVSERRVVDRSATHSPGTAKRSFVATSPWQ